MALSGLQSRLHTIRKYTFPPSSAEAAAAELVRLYVQKGHNHNACHRFLKKRRRRRSVCVHPWAKGFPPPPPAPVFHQVSLAGGPGLSHPTWPNEARMWQGKHQRTLWCVPATNFCESCPIPCFVSMVVHDTSPKPTFPQQLRRRFDCCRLATTMFNFSSDRTHAPFR